MGFASVPGFRLSYAGCGLDAVQSRFRTTQAVAVMTARTDTESGRDELNARLGVLNRREVEARILKPLLAALGAEFGEERVRQVVRETIVDIARAQGHQLQLEMPDNGLPSFEKTMVNWTRDGALEIQPLKSTAEEFHFNVTRCRYAEMYRSLGMEDLGHTLSCQRDFALIEGFNEDVALERTQTIMQGASHCDFRYRLRQPIELG